MGFLSRIFPVISAKKDFLFLDDTIEEFKRINRQTLRRIDNWIDEAAFNKSFFNYGVPDFIKNDINKPVGDELTYTDIMTFLAKKHFAEINYLEIGVSVGKNFFQIINAFEKANMVGFDIEEINPILERELQLLSKKEWNTKSGSLKTNKSSIKEFSYKSNKVAYVSGDVWDEGSWRQLKENKFNLIFSDALHSPEALLFEFEMIFKYDLLADKFIIFWDDLEGRMQNSFFKIIKKYDKEYLIKDVYLLKVNGWIGENERRHTVGIVSNFTI